MYGMFRICLLFLCTLSTFSSIAQDNLRSENKVVPIGLLTSSQQIALQYLDSLTLLEKSPLWPEIDPVLFVQNIRNSIENPASIYPGRQTNFCGYGAITYLMIQNDPLGYAETLLQLYQHGKALYGKVRFKPSKAVRKVAGKLRFKGVLDIRPAEQLWYLCLADHYKGYLNFFNRRYDPGDENAMWAATNFAKFNRMARQLLKQRIHSRGSDLFRPSLGKATNTYISEKLTEGTVLLYLNNRILHKKKIDRIKLEIPTHFIVLQKLYTENNVLTMQYWDYGGNTLIQMNPAFFRRLVFGISYYSGNNEHD